MSVKTRIERLQLRAEKDLEHVFKDIDKVARNRNNAGRKIVERLTKTTTVNHEKFLNELEKLKAPNFVRDFEKYLNTISLRTTGAALPVWARSTEGTIGKTADTKSIRDAWNGFGKMLEKSIGTPVLTGEQAHKEISVIGQRAFILYTHQVMLNRQTQDNPFLMAAGTVQAETFRKVYMASAALLSAPQVLKGTGKESLQDAEDAIAYFEKHTTQEEWEAYKEKTINVLSGIAEQELVIVNKQPKPQTDAEYAIATEMQKAYNADYNNLTTSLREDFTKLKGSKVFEDEVVKQLTTLASGKKPKPYRNTTKKTHKPRNKSSAVKGSAKLKKLKARRKRIKLKTIAPQRARKKGEKASEQSIVSLLRLKSLLNKRLPAAVRSNMGGAALTNMSGQFANSVRIERLRLAEKGLSGDYTYTKTGGGTGGNPRVGVYQVFEHPGSIHNNPNHDPRPLIIKSIRELALQYTDEKFTYLRRI